MGIAFTRNESCDNLIVKFKTYKAGMEQGIDVVAKESAEKVEVLAKAYAPVDEGDIEASFEVIERSTRIGNPIFDVTFGNTPETEEYAFALHEGIMRGKPYELGPLSLEKAASTGQPVGPKFLERAFLLLKPGIVKDYRDVVNKVIG